MTYKTPPRLSYGENEIQAINEVFEYYKQKGEDPGYQGYFEEKFCQEDNAINLNAYLKEIILT